MRSTFNKVTGWVQWAKAKETKKQGAYIKIDEKTKIKIETGKHSSENTFNKRSLAPPTTSWRVTQAIAKYKVWARNFYPAKFDIPVFFLQMVDIPSYSHMQANLLEAGLLASYVWMQ